MKKSQFSRQSFLGENSDQIFENAKVAIVGLGGGGSHIVQQLAHLGVGNFVLFDPDQFEQTNSNRLVGSVFNDITERPYKTTIAERVIRSINPNSRIVVRIEDWKTGAEHLRSCDVVFGCVDSFATRSELEVSCRRYAIPYIDIGMDVFGLNDGFSISGQVILSMPGELCMRCMGFLRDDLLAKEAANYGAAGGKPQVVWPNGVLASTAVGIFIDLFASWREVKPGSIFMEYDGNSHTVTKSVLWDYVEKRCQHFGDLSDLGDPFFRKTMGKH